jgi:hypothetical protein
LGTTLSLDPVLNPDLRPVHTISSSLTTPGEP